MSINFPNGGSCHVLTYCNLHHFFLHVKPRKNEWTFLRGIYYYINISGPFSQNLIRLSDFCCLHLSNICIRLIRSTLQNKEACTLNSNYVDMNIIWDMNLCLLLFKWWEKPSIVCREGGGRAYHTRLNRRLIIHVVWWSFSRKGRGSLAQAYPSHKSSF